jgi:hypothetical protein
VISAKSHLSRADREGSSQQNAELSHYGVDKSRIEQSLLLLLHATAFLE